MDASPTVSVIVPVYNAMPYLRELMESLAVQDLDPAAFTVIAVNDGSTDGSSEFLDDLSRRSANVEVVHQTNSGWPGRPRNVGLRRSTGKYVFFADADDIVAPQSLRRMIEFAERHASDIVIPRLAALGGRRFPASAFERTAPDADLRTAFETFFPQKLFRRQLLVDHDIWFPEGTRLEDGAFNVHAYLHARRISVLGDDDYYFLRARDDGRNTSLQTREPVSYTNAVMEIARIVREHVADSDAAAELVLTVYRRKCLEIYHPKRFPACAADMQDAWMAEHRRFIDRFVGEGLEQRLPSPFRERSYFVRRGDKVGLLELIESESNPIARATLVGARWVSDGVEMAIEAAVRGRLALARQIVCELRQRDSDGLAAFSLSRADDAMPLHGQDVVYKGILSQRTMRDLDSGAYDLHLVSRSEAGRISTRVRWGGVEPLGRRNVEVTGTRRGNATVRKRATELEAARAVSSALRRVIRRLADAPGRER